MVYWIQVIESAAGTSYWLDLDKATSIEIAVSRLVGNELFYVKARVPEGGKESVYAIGKFSTVKEAESFLKGIFSKRDTY
jgi:hypothetical protein